MEKPRNKVSYALSEAAYQLMRERGIDGFTVEEVAERAGESTLAFGDYFSDLEEAAASFPLEKLARVYTEAEPARPGEPVLDLVYRLTQAQFAAGLPEVLAELRDLVVVNPSILPRLAINHAMLLRIGQDETFRLAGPNADRLKVNTVVGAFFGAFVATLSGDLGAVDVDPDEFVTQVYQMIKGHLR
ncbi:helix-turn-helix domain-containing protein [Actinomyces sp. F1_1611]